MSDERMDVEELVDELYELVEKAWNLPLSRGRAMLDVEEVRTILDEIRETMPQEIRQAKAIVADRSQIISDAKREAETIIRVAEERANTLVNQNEIVKQAQQKANEMLAQAQARFREMRKASNEYIEDLMKRADEGLSSNLAELRKTRQNIKASLRPCIPTYQCGSWRFRHRTWPLPAPWTARSCLRRSGQGTGTNRSGA